MAVVIDSTGEHKLNRKQTKALHSTVWGSMRKSISKGLTELKVDKKDDYIKIIDMLVIIRQYSDESDKQILTELATMTTSQLLDIYQAVKYLFSPELMCRIVPELIIRTDFTQKDHQSVIVSMLRDSCAYPCLVSAIGEHHITGWIVDALVADIQTYKGNRSHYIEQALKVVTQFKYFKYQHLDSFFKKLQLGSREILICADVLVENFIKGYEYTHPVYPSGTCAYRCGETTLSYDQSRNCFVDQYDASVKNTQSVRAFTRSSYIFEKKFLCHESDNDSGNN